jgi:hypothetical protein
VAGRWPPGCCPPKGIEGLAREILHRLDPCGGDRYDPDAFTRRSVTCGEDATGIVFGRFQFDPASGAVFKAALDARAKPIPQAEGTTPQGQQVLLRDFMKDGITLLNGRPVAKSDYAPAYTGTTGTENVRVVGDFSNYVIAMRQGLAVEPIAHLFQQVTVGTGPAVPTGQRGLFAWGRIDPLTDSWTCAEEKRPPRRLTSGTRGLLHYPGRPGITGPVVSCPITARGGLRASWGVGKAFRGLPPVRAGPGVLTGWRRGPGSPVRSP